MANIDALIPARTPFSHALALGNSSRIWILIFKSYWNILGCAVIRFSSTAACTKPPLAWLSALPYAFVIIQSSFNILDIDGLRYYWLRYWRNKWFIFFCSDLNFDQFDLKYFPATLQGLRPRWLIAAYGIGGRCCEYIQESLDITLLALFKYVWFVGSSYRSPFKIYLQSMEK